MDELKSHKKTRSKRSTKKNILPANTPLTPSTSLTTQFLPELSKEVLLRADLVTLKNYCSTNTSLHTLCTSKNFWFEKMQYNNLPTPIFDEEAIKKYKKYHKIKTDYQVYYKLYDIILKNKKLIQDILLVNKIEFRRPYNKSKGIIKIDLDLIYEELGSDALLTLFPKESYIFYDLTETGDQVAITPDNYSPNLLKIQLINNDYILEYIVLDLDTEFFLASSVKIDENSLINILGLILFDAELYGTDLDIGDDNNESFLPFNGDINPNSPLIGRESIWDTLKYLKI